MLNWIEIDVDGKKQMSLPIIPASQEALNSETLTKYLHSSSL